MQSNMSAPAQVARRYWNMSLIRGVIAIIFGLLAIFWPHLTFALFMRVFGIFAIVEGFMLVSGASGRRTTSTPQASYARRIEAVEHPAEGYRQEEGETVREQSGYRANRPGTPGQRVVDSTIPTRVNRSTQVVEGIVTIICGILVLLLPAAISTLALYAIAAWALFKGIGALIQSGTRGWALGIIGVLGIIVALLVFLHPLAIIHSLFRLIGIFALILGAFLVVRGLLHNALTRATRPVEPSF